VWIRAQRRELEDRLIDEAMAALVVHASKDGESNRTLFANPVLAIAKARGLSKAGWLVHVVDADGGVYHPEQFDQLLKFPPKKPASKF
jgi:hypothetical protein